ncbi:uncharacterized protein K02A2.6-like [Episyrphus balteatus]|uniref:uncharacterized protein K02A2.6-like n=1 Tax=Episyrphus balteatus TaxID=286459 RepID=UPI002486AB8A|nr:uncharacterized protein K02A2.6-like [Episyrphus balteatus]
MNALVVGILDTKRLKKSAQQEANYVINVAVRIILSGNAEVKNEYITSKTNLQQTPFEKKMKRDSKEHYKLKKLKPDESETIKLLDASDANKKVEYIFCIGDTAGNEIRCKIGGVAVKVVVDSGSKFNIIDSKTWEFLKTNGIKVSKQRQQANHEFKAYGGHPLTVMGVFESSIETKHKCCLADFYVVKDYGKALVGFQTGIPLGVMKIGEDVINQIDQHCNSSKIKGFVVDIPLKEGVKPVAQPYRRVPVPLEEAVDNKINKLLQEGIIEKVNEPSQWISPVVPVPKGDDVRICIDMRRANEAVQRENHPLPTMEDFLPHIGKGRFFTKLDVKDAFHQVEISEESRPITTFITRKGLFRYTRLMFGIACAPELFQKIMEQILVGCKGCLNYMDDIIIYGETIEHLNKRVAKVLETLKSHNVMLNRAKCIFGVTELEFLGHKLSACGIAPTQSKVEAVKNFRCPSSVAEVRSFLGLVNFVGKFIPNLANLTEPLRTLTRQNATFKWQKEQQIRFERLKESLTSDVVLGYYDVQKRTQVYADASPVALGAVLIQISDSDEPRVITYASKSLTDTEKRYCQTEKEALALVWSVERFHFYLFGRVFELVTDHKALETIFSPTSKPCARIERWVLRLQSYNFKVVYKPGKHNIADPLSRLVVTNKAEELFDLDNEQYINYVVANAVPVALKLKEVEEASASDITIRDVKIGLAERIWSDRAGPFKLFETELCFAGNILLRGSRIVMPENLRNRTIELAHEGHPGITVMKRRLRTKVWWPKIDIEAEVFVRKCLGCTMVAAPSAPEPMKRKELPSEPWSHLAIDFMGPLPSSHYLLVVVDYFSRFVEVEIMTKITTMETIKRLRTIFARFGRPNVITADNGTQFTSTEFKDYCTENGIQILHSTPFWPQQNGEVERQNRSILKRLKISQNLHQDWEKELQDYLLMYRTTPHSTTLKSPSELMFGRTVSDKLPQINQPFEYDEELHDRDKTKKEKEKQYADEKRNAKSNLIAVGDLVWLKNLINTNKLSATFEPIDFKVVERSGSEIVVENLETGVRYRRNVTHAIRVPLQNGNREIPTEQEQKQHQQQNDQQSVDQGSLSYQGPTANKRATASMTTDELPPRKRKAPAKFQDYTQ